MKHAHMDVHSMFMCFQSMTAELS